jgi:hypothetical protein
MLVVIPAGSRRGNFGHDGSMIEFINRLYLNTNNLKIRRRK